MTYYIIDSIEELNDLDISEFDYLIKSPSAKLTIFKNKNIKIISDLELFYLLKPNLFYIVVTGTNGKTSTISFLHQILNNLGVKHHYAGNMGIPLFSIINKVKDNDIILIEASSYMLEATTFFKPNLYTITNLSTHHLDHHDTINNYYNTKLNILNRLNEMDVFINLTNINLDNFSNNFRISKIYFNLDEFSYLTDFDKINILNVLNNLFYIYEYLKIPFSVETILNQIKCLKKEPYRFQIIYKDQNLTVINDSKSTNVASGFEALNSCLKENKNVLLIMGGKKQVQEYKKLYPLIKKVQFLYLFGECSNDLFVNLKKINKNTYKFKTLSEVIKDLNFKKGIILFSPMHQSFDQFKDFTERGLIFNKLISRIL